LNDFFVIEHTNWRVTNILSASSEVEAQCRKHKKGMNDSMFQVFGKIVLNLSLIPSPYFFSFLVCLE
jgi:hypothetical protein